MVTENVLKRDTVRAVRTPHDLCGSAIRLSLTPARKRLPAD